VARGDIFFIDRKNTNFWILMMAEENGFFQIN